MSVRRVVLAWLVTTFRATEMFQKLTGAAIAYGVAAFIGVGAIGWGVWSIKSAFSERAELRIRVAEMEASHKAVTESATANADALKAAAEAMNANTEEMGLVRERLSAIRFDLPADVNSKEVEADFQAYRAEQRASFEAALKEYSGDQ